MLQISNSQQFKNEVENASGLVIVDFFATWCGPCKMLAPVFEEVSTMMRGQVKFVKIDVEELTEISRKYNIRSVPTIMMFKDGKLVETMTGFMPKDKLIKKLNNHI